MTKTPEREKQKSPPPESGESRASEALTIAWTQSVLTVALCNGGAAVSRLYLAARPEATTVGLLSQVLLFAATVIGVVSLVLLPFVLRTRQIPPPRGFVVFALVMGVAPLATTLFRMLR